MERSLSGAARWLDSPDAHRLTAGELEAVFLPDRGMLGASLRRGGIEFLRLVERLDAVTAEGEPAGIPILHPWANRLAGSRFRIAGREVSIDLSSPLLHRDPNGLLIHGVPWSRLVWALTEARQDRLSARLAWDGESLLAVFPFRHHVELAATLHPDGLTLETTLVAGRDAPVPVSFGFHPYFGLPGLSRAQWHLSLPAMRRLILDRYGIPTGAEESFGPFEANLSELHFDDGFDLLDEPASLSVAGAGYRISVDLLAGYRHAQVFAPRDKDYLALEPMTAPTNALVSGRGLRIVEPGGSYRAAFRIRIDQQPLAK